MKPVYQTITAPGHGNCVQACIASIFELRLDQVPNFVEAVDWAWALIQFCEHLGVHPVFIDRTKSDPGKNVGRPGGWWSIVTGQSPRGDYLHAVVAFNGEIMHDPHPDGGGKIGDLVDEIIFVVKDPSGLRQLDDIKEYDYSWLEKK